MKSVEVQSCLVHFLTHVTADPLDVSVCVGGIQSSHGDTTSDFVMRGSKWCLADRIKNV